MKHSFVLALLSTVPAALYAQVSDQVQQATISGSRGTSGKCTMEVRVDHIAEVDVYGNSGRLRTLAGQPATWTRMECTDPLPYNMTDFRFKGIDGRGNVKLVQDPRNNRGMAVIRIEDTRSGSEGYTFDIEWSGASGGAPTDGFSRGGILSPSNDGSRGSNRAGRRIPTRAMSAERAIDLCRSAVRERAERDHGFGNIDITAAAMDSSGGRQDRITGTFNDGTRRMRRGSAYRFNCTVDGNAGQISNVEILRADGSALQSQQSQSTSYPTGYDQNRVFRACQDAVVARTARDGYQNVSFASTSVDQGRSSVSGRVTGSRGPVTDTFDFNCTMDLNSATVRNVELNRR